MQPEKQKTQIEEQKQEQEPTKLLGAHVDEQLYWAFKNAATVRNEQLKDAITHAARMYIDTVSTRGET